MPAILEREPTGLKPDLKSDFRVDYDKNASDKALFDDVVTYLGEYRFNLLKSPYELKYSGGKLRNRHTGEAMSDTTRKALKAKISENNNCSRESGENEGITALDWQLSVAREGDTVVWSSPPGSQEEGYGKYGFLFIGHVGADDSTGKKVSMTAIRVEDPKIQQFNQAMYLLTGEKKDYKTAEEFLARPKVIRENLNEGYIDAILGKTFGFKSNPAEMEKFTLIIRQMSPLIAEFIQSVKDPFKTKNEKRREFYALENYFLKLKADYDRPETRRENFIVNFNAKPKLLEIREKYGNKPPEVAGSCPASTTNKSSNIFSKGLLLNNLLEDEIDYEFDKAGPCGKCNADVKCGPCGLCKACDLAIRASQRINFN